MGTIRAVGTKLGYAEWELNGSIVVDDLHYDAIGEGRVAADNTFSSVTGWLNYSFGGFEIEPRTASDVVD